MLDAIGKLPVTDEEREGIRWRNAARLLGLEERSPDRRVGRVGQVGARR